ncbi:MAG: butyrate kinase [Clostridiales bacterium]|nr:butyrate kinase [Clostridiales bacterium]
MFKIVVMNLGSTSSKLAYWEDEVCLLKENLEHPTGEIGRFGAILDQYQYRFDKINDFLLKKGIDYKDADAVVSRGGHTRPLVGGIYRINERMLAEIKSGQFGRHACDIGVLVAYQMAREGRAVPMVVDPPVTDEFEPLARYSGLPELPRRSSFHALNHRACGKQHARKNSLDYTKLNLIVVHMGGGITVAAHRQGRMIDATNGIEGDGPFSTNRTGALPVGALVDMCYSGEYSQKEMHQKLNGNGGMMAYLGESDMRLVRERGFKGDRRYMECFDAMMYQVCKEIGAMAAVLKGRVDAVLLTGGMAHSGYVQISIAEAVGFIAPVVAYPGEFEMEALARGALAGLAGQEEIKELEDHPGNSVKGLL